MKKRIIIKLRTINQWLDIYMLNIVLIVIVGGFLVFVVLMTAVALWTPQSLQDSIEREWLQQQAALEADPAWQAEQARLHKKHGLDHVIVYTPEGASYVNAQGQKCRFM